MLTAAGKRIDAVSWHSGGGTWGTLDGVAYARGNDGTDRHRIRALLVDVGDGFAADYGKVGNVTGKVVLVRSRAPGTQVIEAAQHGAVALLMYDPDRREDALRTGLLGYNDQVPAAAIKRIDAVSLQRALVPGPVEVTLENRIDVKDGVSSNVIATVIGTEFPDEWITVSGHHDRWFKGAADNCSGVASMLELARLLTSGGYHPRRSMLFISFGSEESGIDATSSSFLAGSHAFVKQHPEITRRLVLGVNMDITGVAGGLPDSGRGTYTYDA